MRKIVRRIFSIVLVLALIINILPVSAFANALGRATREDYCENGSDTPWEVIKPNSSWADYGAAALSGAVGATGIGFWGSVAANAGISGGQYLANCAMEGEDMSLGGFALAIGEGALSGRKGTGSKHYTKLGTQTMKRTFNAGVHKGFKAGLSECGRAFAYYAKNTKTYYKKALRGLRNDLVITSVNTVAESILFGG